MMKIQKAQTTDDLQALADPGPQIRYLLTMEEAARALALSARTMYELVGNGAIKSVKVGRARRVPTAAIEMYVSQLMEEAAS